MCLYLPLWKQSTQNVFEPFFSSQFKNLQTFKTFFIHFYGVFWLQMQANSISMSLRKKCVYAEFIQMDAMSEIDRNIFWVGTILFVCVFGLVKSMNFEVCGWFIILNLSFSCCLCRLILLLLILNSCLKFVV